VVGQICGSGDPVGVHDPHPEGGGLAGPAEWVGVVLALNLGCE
jgi:hypothetical protein